MARIKASLDDPLGYEAAGFAVFDLYPERRGNLFSDEVYRLVKAHDATTTFSEQSQNATDELPLYSKYITGKAHKHEA